MKLAKSPIVGKACNSFNRVIRKSEATLRRQSRYCQSRPETVGAHSPRLADHRSVEAEFFKLDPIHVLEA